MVTSVVVCFSLEDDRFKSKPREASVLLSLLFLGGSLREGVALPVY
jgi:hypothetical protein